MSIQPPIDTPIGTPTERLTHHLRWTRPPPTNKKAPFLARLQRLITNLSKRRLYEEYDRQIQQFEERHYIRRVDPRSIKFWLNHFPVVKGDVTQHSGKSSMKLRPVFDGGPLAGFISAQLPPGCEQGVIQSIGLLRHYQHFVCIDLQQAFLSVSLPSIEDQLHTGFLWKAPNTTQPTAYCFQRVLFGLPDSPYALVEALNKVIQKCKIPAHHIRTLMDDISIASDDAQHLADLVTEVRSGLKNHRFTENVRKLLTTLPECRPREPEGLLGLIWDPKTDTLSVRTELKHLAANLTTLADLRAYSTSLFDPLGICLEYVMRLRKIVRGARLDTDSLSKLSSGIRTALVKWEDELKTRDHRVPRVLHPADWSHAGILCLFTDSSDQAGAGILTTSYGRRMMARGFLQDESIKNRTAPRFELDTLAISLGWTVKLLTEANDYLHTASLLVFTDNLCSVLRLRRTMTLLPTSVSQLVTTRRLVKIRNALFELESMGISVYIMHLSGTDNIADAASRCRTADVVDQDYDALFQQVRDTYDDILRCDRDLLSTVTSIYRLPSDYRPTTPPTRVVKTEKTKKSSTKTAETDDDDGIPCPLDEINVITATLPFTDPPTSAEDLMKQYYAAKLLVKSWHLLRSEFSNGDAIGRTATPLTLLVRHQQAQDLAGFDKLPFHRRDENGDIVKVSRQRIDGSSYHQLVIPKHSLLLQRLATIQEHVKHHQGIGGTLRRLTPLYSWLKMKRTVVSVCRTCRSCLHAKPQRTVSSAAGSLRAPKQVWEFIGLDHTGPYDVPLHGKDGLSTHSESYRFCLVATCLLSGFIAAVATPSLSARHTLLGLKAILATTGTPSGIRLDNSKSFTNPLVRSFCLARSIRLQYIPPRCPNRGGTYERSHGPFNEQLRILQGLPQPWPLTVLQAAHIANCRHRWDAPGPTSPWEMAHTYPPNQATPSAALAECLSGANQPNGRLADWIFNRWETSRETTRLRAGDDPDLVGLDDVVYLQHHTRRPTKLGSPLDGPFRVLQRDGNMLRLSRTTGGGKIIISQPVDKVVRTVSAADAIDALAPNSPGVDRHSDPATPVHRVDHRVTEPSLRGHPLGSKYRHHGQPATADDVGRYVYFASKTDLYMGELLAKDLSGYRIRLSTYSPLRVSWYLLIP
ncbi:gag/pol/env polyprotein, putative [Perkinsus marinus ATCC 50983]|uniref:Gag/pol/env polyprotein, putative n=1 Tax=Perkinsus marinus (strain ATCC 50983 / TXsc) TaxID=423536 RepID=C5M148_PERM5|nr:gag/pol/env polyprotein, putative [Perkinsus marinus ATCC 50983]EEQ97278.1 gag/pol/env polyprotein, putative [Perkinsus marinus ATCC 50983]|eukprot:XP_002764561.1 gag/pol/env polyprotein, putative [Perkinsus marinus ATCC 50983]